MANEQTGTLIIIGGHEDKEDNKEILRAVGQATKGGKLVIATVASRVPAEYFAAYQAAFAGLGAGELLEVYVQERAEAADQDKLAVFEGAAGVFFTGGDQLRISSQMGDTPLEARVRDIFARGGVVAGTSAGASAMAETMLVRGASGESHRIGDLHLAPGLGLIRNVIIDQHFAERGRIGRLLGAVAFNPRMLGIGIDEDTAIVVRNDTFRVIGSGAVYVVDAVGSTHSNIAEAAPQSALSMFDVRMHVLSAGDRFDIPTRRPVFAASIETSHQLETEAAARNASEIQPQGAVAEPAG